MLFNTSRAFINSIIHFQYEITVMEAKLEQMKPNMAAIADYRKKVESSLKPCCCCFVLFVFSFAFALSD